MLCHPDIKRIVNVNSFVDQGDKTSDCANQQKESGLTKEANQGIQASVA
jgi:hypothetical protein